MEKGTAPTRDGLPSFLDDLRLMGDAPAFVRHTSYRRFAWSARRTREAALAVAARLGARIAPGDRVLLYGPDSPEWVAAFLGIAAAGGVIVPCEAGAEPDLVRRIAAKTEASAAIVPARDRSTVEGVVPFVLLFEELASGEAAGGAPPGAASIDRAATVEIVFTSGTTSDPKGVELTSDNLLASLSGIERGFRKREWFLRPLLPMRFLCLVPLSHLFGQALGVFIPILMRSTAVFSATLEPHRLLGLIREEHPLAVITVPRVLAGLRDAVLREAERRGQRVKLERAIAAAAGRRFARRVVATRAVRSILGWRSWVFVVGGAALEPEVEEFWTRCGFVVVQGYGMTEAAPIITVQNPFDRAHTLGRPVGGVEVRLAEDGEVLVRGPNVMKGYYRDPGATREALQDGWLRTGDLAERDAAGRLYFKGRKKEVIVLPGGLNVHPSDVEAALLAQDEVREAVVFAGRGESGDEVHAVVLPRGPVDPEAIRARSNVRLAPHQRIRALTVWDEPDFPRTGTGKARRGTIAAIARARGAPAVPGSHGRVAAALARLHREGRGRIDEDARLSEDLGLDSLEMLELTSILEEEHDVSLPSAQSGAARTVGDLERDVARVGARSTPLAMPRWGRRVPVRALRAICRALLLRPAYAGFVSLKVEGRENVPVSGPCLVVANHTSMLDTPTVLFSLPRAIRGKLAPAMATEPVAAHFSPAGRSFGERLRAHVSYTLAVALFHAYPLPRSAGFRPSLEYTGELLDAGFWPLVFPEGHMRGTSGMAPFRSGIGLLAVETRVPVLPVRLVGLAEILPPDARWPSGRGDALVRIGAPLLPAELRGLDPVAATERIERAVRELA